MVRRGQSCKDPGEKIPGRRMCQYNAPETEPSLSGSWDGKEVRVAGAVCGRKREVGASSEREAGPDHKVGPWRIAKQTFLLVLFELQPRNTLDCQCQFLFQMLLTVTS